MCIIPAKIGSLFGDGWFMRGSFFVVVGTISALWELDLWLMGLKVFLESPIIFPVSEQGSVETAGMFIPCCYFSTPLEQPQSTGPGFKKCWWSTFGFPGSQCPGKSGVFCPGLCLSLTPSDRWASGFRFYLQRLPLPGCLLSSFLSCWRAQMGCWTRYFFIFDLPITV